jgi:cold shock CspA family protein
MEAKLIGTIHSFIPAKGFGFIAVPNANGIPARFFLHISRIISGAENLSVGATVKFSVSPIKEGNLPSAIDVEIVGAVL